MLGFYTTAIHHYLYPCGRQFALRILDEVEGIAIRLRYCLPCVVVHDENKIDTILTIKRTLCFILWIHFMVILVKKVSYISIKINIYD